MFSRRDFVCSLGLGLGVGCSSRSQAKGSEQAPVVFSVTKDTWPSLSEYEQIIARTRPELIGIPRCWQDVRDGLHPFSANRVGIFSAAQRCIDYEELIHNELTHLREYHSWRGTFWSKEKVSAAAWIVWHLLRSYGMGAHRRRWLASIATWESFCPSGYFEATNHYRFQPTPVCTTCPPVDWWLMLFPNGTDYGYGESIDPVRVYVLVIHAFDFTPVLSRDVSGYARSLNVMGLGERCASFTSELGLAKEIANAEPHTAARWMNSVLAQVLLHPGNAWSTLTHSLPSTPTDRRCEPRHEIT